MISCTARNSLGALVTLVCIFPMIHKHSVSLVSKRCCSLLMPGMPLSPPWICVSWKRWNRRAAQIEAGHQDTETSKPRMYWLEQQKNEERQSMKEESGCLKHHQVADSPPLPSFSCNDIFWSLHERRPAFPFCQWTFLTVISQWSFMPPLSLPSVWEANLL